MKQTILFPQKNKETCFRLIGLLSIIKDIPLLNLILGVIYEKL